MPVTFSTLSWVDRIKCHFQEQFEKIEVGQVLHSQNMNPNLPHFWDFTAWFKYSATNKHGESHI